MNIEQIELKGKVQATVVGMIDQIQSFCKVDRPTARRIALMTCKCTIDTIDLLVEEGGKTGAFGMLTAAMTQKKGAEAGIRIILEDETL